MVAASLIATITTEDMTVESVADLEDDYEAHDEDGVKAEVTQFKNGQYLCMRALSLTQRLRLDAGEYKTILQLVTVLSHGKREPESTP